MLHANEILTTASETISQRGKTYDKKGEERSFQQIATVFNSVNNRNLNLLGSDVALLLVCLKLVRQSTSPDFHLDSAIDGTAFMALYGEQLSLEQMTKEVSKYKEGIEIQKKLVPHDVHR